MQPDTTPDLEELTKLEKAATPGPWEWDEPVNWAGLAARVMKTTPYGLVAHVQISGWKPRRVGTSNATLIAAARNALPWLLRAARERDELRETLKGYDATSLVLDEKFCALEKENAELRTRAEKAEADLAESKRLAYIADRINEEVRQAGSHPQVQNYTSMDEFRAALRGLGDRLLHTRQELAEALSSDAESLAMYHRARDRADALQAELAEARAEIDRIRAAASFVVENRDKITDAVDKADALDELEAWLRESESRIAIASSFDDIVGAALTDKLVSPDSIETIAHHGEAPTLAAAIRAALEKARGA